VLPIDGRPVIATLLRELATLEPRRVVVVVGHLGEQVQALVGDGAAFGVDVVYALQPRPLGSADALRLALEAGAEPPLAVTGADTVYLPGDIRAAAEAWRASGLDGGLAVREVPEEELPERSSVAVEGNRLLDLVEKPRPGEAPSRLAGAMLWFVGATVLPSLEGLPGPPFELAELFRRSLARGLPIAALEIGPTRDLTSPEDIVRRNFPYLSSR
jgi:NDP-sugar pyrophosphorylase family protein